MFIKREEGQSMVEFALVLLPLLVIVCGIIDFGWIFGHHILFDNAGREAARYTAIHYSDSGYSPSDTEDMFHGRVPDGVNNVSIDSMAPVGGEIVFRATGKVDVLTPLPGILGAGPFTIKTETTMKLEM